jgi:hypothetical protein
VILLLKALSRPLQAEGAKIKKLAGVVAHGAGIARAAPLSNFSQKI